MEQTPPNEGKLPFKIPGKSDVACFTYYKIIGDISKEHGAPPPVVVLHGGPGTGHEYLLSFADLWPQYGIPVVFYDQIGCASSTHLPQFAGDKAFWQESLFIDELDSLLDALNLRDGPGFHLLGHSWGGMFGASFAGSRPRGLQRLVLASGLASNELAWQSIQARRRELSPETLRAMEKCEQEQDFDNPAYKEALMIFNSTFFCRDDPPPSSLMPAMQHLSEDKTVYETMIGRSVQIPTTGSLLGWTSIPRLHLITSPTLVYNGEFDTSHDLAQEPFLELIPRVRRITFSGGSHMCHVEGGGLRERVLKAVGDFLTQGRGLHD